MSTFFVDFDNLFAIGFEDAPEEVERKYRVEFPDRVLLHSSAPLLVRVLFSDTPVPLTRKIGARALNTDSAFFLVDEKGKRIEIDFSQMHAGKPFNLIVERGISSRFLQQVTEGCMKALAPSVGGVFIHSSAFRIHGKAVLIGAWAHTGKTNTLLTFLQDSAEFYGDDWTILSTHGLVAYPKTLNLFGYNIDRFPTLRKRLPFHYRLVFKTTSLLFRLLRPFANSSSQLGHYVSTLSSVVQNQGHVRIAASALFPGVRIASPARPTLVALAQRSFTEQKPSCTPLTRELFADRMAPCLKHERANLLEWYSMFLFAFPKRRSLWLDNLEQTEHDVLFSSLSSTPIVSLDLGDGTDILAIKRCIEKRLV